MSLDTTGATAFEEHLVSRVFGPWAQFVVALAEPRRGERVLDVACATGAATRAAAAAAGRAVGVDIDSAMISVARSRASELGDEIDWHCADAARLPFGNAAFDLCFCLQGLQFFPDRVGALREMRRVLAPNGRLFVSVWASIEHAPGYYAVAQALERECIDASSIRQAFQLSAPGHVQELLENAGFFGITIRTEERSASFPSVDAFLAMLTAGSRASCNPFNDIAAGRRDSFRASVRDRLAPFIAADGLNIPYRAHIAQARPRS